MITLVEKLIWIFFDSFVNLFFIRFLKNKRIDWGNNKLQKGLEIMNDKKPECLLNGFLGGLGQPYLRITLAIWSKIPIKLYPKQVIGRVETIGYETYIHWDKMGKEIYRHAIKNIELGKNIFIFIIKIPLETLKNNECLHASWHFYFTVEFERGISKTFNDIIFRIRDPDIKRLYAHTRKQNSQTHNREKGDN